MPWAMAHDQETALLPALGYDDYKRVIQRMGSRVLDRALHLELELDGSDGQWLPSLPVPLKGNDHQW